MLMQKRKVDKTGNAVNVIYPYRTSHGTWVYDDEDLGVYSEAFVCGSSEVIDHLVGEETNTFTAAISAAPIPGYQAKLVRLDNKEGMTGWYRLDGTDMEHWLCSCVLDYFPDYPAEIYVLFSDLKK